MWTNKSKRDRRKGTTAVEMALIAPMFFLLLVGTMELSLMLTAQQLLENATFNASRLAKTGYVNANQTQLATVQQILTQELQSFGAFINPNQIQMTSQVYNSFAAAQQGTGGTPGLGTPDQIVVYTVSYPWTFMTPMIGSLLGQCAQGTNTCTVNLTSQMVVRNEPYN